MSQETLPIPVDTIWMKSPMIPDGSERGHDLPSTRKLKTKVKEAPIQSAPMQNVQPVAQSVEEMPRVSAPPRPAPRQRAPEPVEDAEIPSIQYTGAPAGPSNREKELEAELMKYRAALQRQRVVREPEPEPEEHEDESVEEVPQKSDVPTKKTRSKKSAQEGTSMMTYVKYVAMAGVGLFLLGGRGGAPAAAAVKPAAGVNPWY